MWVSVGHRRLGGGSGRVAVADLLLHEERIDTVFDQMADIARQPLQIS